MTEPDHWIGTWSTTPAPADRTAFNNQTLRMNARVSIEGQVHTSTPDQRHGTGDLHIGAARIALLAGIMPGTGRTLTFNGAKSATIAALDPPNGLTNGRSPLFRRSSARFEAAASSSTWHLRKAFAPLTFTDENIPDPGRPSRPSRPLTPGDDKGRGKANR